jgi:tyrosine-protein phosphatase non-receptor type 4
MDTAMALLELQSPIYPLELVQTMRDQRASMVQNAVSIELMHFNILT